MTALLDMFFAMFDPGGFGAEDDDDSSCDCSDCETDNDYDGDHEWGEDSDSGGDSQTTLGDFE